MLFLREVFVDTNSEHIIRSLRRPCNGANSTLFFQCRFLMASTETILHDKLGTDMGRNFENPGVLFFDFCAGIWIVDRLHRPEGDEAVPLVFALRGELESLIEMLPESEGKAKAGKATSIALSALGSASSHQTDMEGKAMPVSEATRKYLFEQIILFFIQYARVVSVDSLSEFVKDPEVRKNASF
jgi:hypothetical protein